MWSSEQEHNYQSEKRTETGDIGTEQVCLCLRDRSATACSGTLTWNKIQIWILRGKSENSFWVLGSSGDYILTILQFSAWDTLVFLWEIRDIQCNTTNSQRTKMPIFLCMAAVLSRSSSQWELRLHLSGKCWSVSATSVSHRERNVEKLDGQTSRYEIKGWTENQGLKFAKEHP